MKDFDFVDDDLTFKKKKGSDESWVTSFADVVTVLLCFFIVFYMVEKKTKNIAGFGSEEGTIQAYKSIASNIEVMTLVETVKQLDNVTVMQTDQFLEIHFPPASFFKIGETVISKDGLGLLNSVYESLDKVGKNFFLQIQGYTDSSLVIKRKQRWWKDNMQLSILRSLSVYNYLLDHGIDKNNLSIAGFGANRPLEGEENKNQRRITIRIEPKNYENN